LDEYQKDELAKKTIKPHATQPTRFCLPGEKWSCYVAGVWKVMNITEKLWHHTNSIAIDEHWDQKMI